MTSQRFFKPVAESANRGRPPVQSSRNPARRINKAVIVPISVAVLAVVLVACSTSPGEPAASFEFTLFQGQEQLGEGVQNLEQLEGKPVVLNFWAGLCPPCRAEMPDLQVFHEEFSDQLTLIGIDLGQFTGLGIQQDAKDLLEELGVTYPTGFTNDSSVVGNYQILGLPVTVFIDADGTVFKNWGGVLNGEILREQSLAMLNQ